MPWDLKKASGSALQHRVEETLRDCLPFSLLTIFGYLFVFVTYNHNKRKLEVIFARFSCIQILKGAEAWGAKRKKIKRLATSVLSFYLKASVTLHSLKEPQKPKPKQTEKPKQNNTNKNPNKPGVGKNSEFIYLTRGLLWTPYPNFPKTTYLAEVFP